jgi:DHA1 family bicyclomycin/chloramphenicol resistance-like MFS transporter
MTTQPSLAVDPRGGIGFTEFVAMIAGLMAMTALSIDVMLPALPAIGDSLGVVNDNDRQWVIAGFVLGFGAAQIVHGPLSDRYGRRPVLLTSLLIGGLFSIVAAFSASFELLIAARVACGMAVAACRVLAVSIVRDRFAGRQMARVMSLAFIVFMAAPVLAPAIGQAILLVAPWRWIFGVLAFASAALFAWAALRLPETLAPEDRLPLSWSRLWQGWNFTLKDRMSLGYMTALAMLTGALFGFINSVQQIFFDIFEAPGLLTPVFAGVASTMAVASFVNSKIVVRLGMRVISQWSLIGFVLFGVVHLLFALSGQETIWSFAIVQGLMMACFGLSSSNFGAMAMENMGGLAGTASSVQGFVGTVAGALIGLGIGQAFDGTTVPLYTGFVVCGAIAFLVVAITERGRLFRSSSVAA